jgi:hypothetical protein
MVGDAGIPFSRATKAPSRIFQCRRVEVQGMKDEKLRRELRTSAERDADLDRFRRSELCEVRP